MSDQEAREAIDKVQADIDRTWTVAELDVLHAQVGLGDLWQASDRRAELLAEEEGL